MPTQIEKRIRLSPERAQYLRQLAQTHQVSEEQIIDQALDLLFSAANFLDAPIQRSGRVSRKRVESQGQGDESLRTPSEEDFKNHLREIGLLAPRAAATLISSTEDRSPIRIKGKPLSETIIDERR